MLDDLVEALRAADTLPRTPDEARLLIQTCQLVATGQPVSEKQVAHIASDLHIPLASVTTFLARVSEFDADGNVVGIMGLSQNAHPHRFRIADRLLSTWCAWDALYLPPLLRVTAQVETTCPMTTTPIRLMVTPVRVEYHQPSSTVLSFVVPPATQQPQQSVQETWRSFCCDVLFFSSAEAASEGFKNKPYAPIILSIEDGYRLGQKALGDIVS